MNSKFNTLWTTLLCAVVYLTFYYHEGFKPGTYAALVIALTYIVVTDYWNREANKA